MFLASAFASSQSSLFISVSWRSIAWHIFRKCCFRLLCLASSLLNTSMASLVSWLQGFRLVRSSSSGVRGGEVLVSRLFLLYGGIMIGLVLAVGVGNDGDRSQILFFGAGPLCGILGM